MTSNWPNIMDESSIKEYMSRNIAAGGTYVTTFVISLMGC